MNVGGGQRGEEERQNGVVDILCRKKDNEIERRRNATVMCNQTMKLV